MVLDWNSDGLESRFWSYLFNRFIDRKRSSERRHGCSYFWTIAWAIISYNLSNWLAKEGWLPTYELKKSR